MTAIDNFSEEPKYPIKKVSALTGILPITLRAWERRYQILSPHRSANRYRLYSERDIAVLRWIKQRVDLGISISEAADELRQMRESGSLPEALPSGVALEAGPSALSPERLSRELYEALVKHDEAAANALMRSVFASCDLMTAITRVFTPTLVEVGDAWYRGDIRISTEHFASAFLRGKMIGLFQGYPTLRGSPVIIIGGAPTEEHEIGALMLAVLARSAGYAVEFLGADIPLDDLADHARYEKPAMIILTATTRPAALELKRAQEKFNRLRPAPIFGYGGFAFNYEPDLRKLVAGQFMGETLDAALATIIRLLGPGSAEISNLKPPRAAAGRRSRPTAPARV